MEININTIINAAITAFLGLGVWIVKQWVESIHERLTGQAQQIRLIELEYARKEELHQMEVRIMEGFNRLNDKLDAWIMGK